MTVEWNRTVTEVVWESQTAPGITWTTVVGGTSSGGGVTVHNDLSGRSAADAHPMSAITDLEPALTDIATAVQAQQGDIGTLQTAVAGKQAADADLTAIAALAPSDDALIQRKSGAWTSRTPAQVKADMSIGVGDVSGLDENTRDVIGTALVAGSGVAVTVDDPGNTITIAVSGVVADAINDGTTTVAPSQNAVFDALALKSPLASPGFTGTPTAPTATPGTNTTQVATTAFVAADTSKIPKSLIDAKGDLLVGTANDTVDRLPVSGTNGRVLTEDSTQPAGVKWAAGGIWTGIAPRRLTTADYNYPYGVVQALPSTLITGANYVYYGTFFCPPRDILISGLRTRLGTGANGTTGSLVRMGVFKVPSADIEGTYTLVADAGTAAFDVGVGATITISGLSIVCSANEVYCLGMTHNNGSNINMMPYSGSPLTGTMGDSPSGIMVNTAYTARTFAAFPSSITPDTISTGAQIGHRCWVSARWT